MTPCAFDRIDRLVLDDALNTQSIFLDDLRASEGMTEYDPDDPEPDADTDLTEQARRER